MSNPDDPNLLVSRLSFLNTAPPLGQLVTNNDVVICIAKHVARSKRGIAIIRGEKYHVFLDFKLVGPTDVEMYMRDVRNGSGTLVVRFNIRSQSLGQLLVRKYGIYLSVDMDYNHGYAYET